MSNEEAGSTPPQPPPKAKASSAQKTDFWWLLPFVSAIIFGGLFLTTAKFLKLDAPFWNFVMVKEYSNHGINQTKAIPEANDVNALGPTKEMKRSVSLLPRELSIRMFAGIAGVMFAFSYLAVMFLSVRIISIYSPISKYALARVVGIVIVALGIYFAKYGFGFDLKIRPTGGGMAAEELLRATAATNSPLRGDNPAEPIPEKTLSTMVTLFAGSTPVLIGIGIATFACASLLDTARVLRKAVGAEPPGKNPDLHESVRSSGKAERDEQEETGGNPTNAGLPGSDCSSKSEKDYERVLSYANWLLQLTALALIGGVIAVYMMYLLTSYHVDSRLQFDVQYYAQVLAVSAGVVYSGFLSAIFVPLYAELVRLSRILRATSPAKEPEKTPGSHAPEPSGTSEIPLVKTVLALISPALAAFAALLVSHLKDVMFN